MNEPERAQTTLVLIKPDGIKKSLTGSVINKLSEARLFIIGARMVKVGESLAKSHYAHLSDKPFFPELVRYLMGELHGADYSRVLALVYYGEDAIQKVRKVVGATNPEEADPTSIRGAYGRITTKGVYENVVHASSSPEDSKKEIQLWFTPDEIVMDIYPTKVVPADKGSARIWA